jgi:polyether ionophore transport system permease protein
MASPAGGMPAGPSVALIQRGVRDARTRTLSFAYLFAIYAYIQPVGYRSAYPTLADRIGFTHNLAPNAALRLFYGYPYDPLSVGGYTAWRVGGTVAILAAVFGTLAAIRALRAEEDSGRAEVILACPIPRGAWLRAGISVVAITAAALWIGETAGLVAGGLGVADSAYQSLATAGAVAVFAGVGAVACQLASTRRGALQLSLAAVAVGLALRVIADTTAGAGWVRWTTPLGWAEELRPFTGARPAVLLLPVLATLALGLLAARLARSRDLGTGLLPARDSAPPRLRLLGSSTAQSLRAERGSLLAWLLGSGAFALVLGVVASGITPAVISGSVRREIAKLGTGSIVTPTGYIAFVFIFFVLALSLFACAQISSARQEEAEQRLETLLSAPVSRTRWLGGRLCLAAVAAAVIGPLAGLLAWAGASSQGVVVSLPDTLGAGANCIPAALLFLGLAALAYAAVPRAATPLAYGLVTVTFVWYLLADLLGAPAWLAKLTPFAHVGLIPVQSFRTLDAVVMVVIGLAAAAASLELIRRRDLVGG